MNATLFTFAGQVVTLTTAIAAFAVLQFIVIAIWSGTSKAKFAKTGPRASEIALLVSSCVLLGVWGFAFDAIGSIRAASAGETAQASVAEGKSEVRGSCASLESGMKTSQVRRKIGEPDRIVDESDVRGNGAEIWVYEGRCVAHVFESKVEFVE